MSTDGAGDAAASGAMLTSDTKLNNRYFTVNNVKDLFETRHKDISEGFIFAYMDLAPIEIKQLPDDPAKAADFNWNPYDAGQKAERYKLQYALLNGSSPVACHAYFQKQINKASPLEWFKREWLWADSADDDGFLPSMIQRLLSLRLAAMKKKVKSDYKKELQTLGAIQKARDSGDHAMTETAAALLASQPRGRRGTSRVRTGSRARSARRNGSVGRGSVRSHASSTGMTAAARGLGLNDEDIYMEDDVQKKELKDMLVKFVWVEVLEPWLEEKVKLTATAPVRFDSWFSQADKDKNFQSMTELKDFRFEARSACPTKPRPSASEVTASLYSMTSKSFWSVKLVDDPCDDPEDEEQERKMTKKQTAGLFQQAWEEAYNTVETFQVFVTRNREDLKLIPHIDCMMERDIPPERTVTKQPPPDEIDIDVTTSSDQTPIQSPSSRTARFADLPTGTTALESPTKRRRSPTPASTPRKKITLSEKLASKYALPKFTLSKSVLSKSALSNSALLKSATGSATVSTTASTNDSAASPSLAGGELDFGLATEPEKNLEEDEEEEEDVHERREEDEGIRSENVFLFDIIIYC
ncbi:hypothetical protein KCU92_g5684, partial [Aureobasidium melanogenum]